MVACGHVSRRHHLDRAALQGSCEREAALADDLLLWLHQSTSAAIPSTRRRRPGRTDGLGSAVEELLRASGVDVEKAMRAASGNGEEEEEGCADG